ncbi:ATP-binding cassette domain-containing protein [Xanthobacter sp. DSM 24535]|uniref:ATP-binding cassette domain-containing protein n=1 Tax=Roseixanthobacter psychrophilus TaxID=3119917 RepID=UPI00372B1153
MNHALDHAEFGTRQADAPPGETLPGALVAAARRHATRPALRHKTGGIWRTWTFADYLARTAAMARLLDGAGFTGAGLLVSVGENRPELYAVALGAQGLGAAVMPLGPDFLRRFGAPEAEPALVLCENEEAAGVWRAVSRTSAPVLRLDELGPSPEEAREDGIAWFAWRAATVDGDQTALILRTDGADGPPRPVALSHRRLLAAGKTAVSRLELVSSDRLMAFLPASGIADAAGSLVQPLLSGCCVHCVEGPASFPIDLKEVAPTVLPAPARVFELIDRDAHRRLAGGGPLVRGLARAAETGAPGAGLAFAAPLRNTLGISACRLAFVTSGTLEPGAATRLMAFGLPLDTDLGLAEDGSPSVRAGTPADETTLLRRVEALLRSEPGIDRARVTRDAVGLRARIALASIAGDTEDDAAARAATAVERVNARLVAEGDGQPVSITALELAPDGFGPQELTLDGEVRHVMSAAVALAADDARTERASRAQGKVLMVVSEVAVAFGGVKALTDVTLAIHEGEILSIIGPNGAGKTSLLNVINGVYDPRAGSITFAGKVRARMRPAFAARSGIGRTFQHVSLFRGMNVIDNVLVGRAARFRGTLLGKLLRLPSTAVEERREREAAERILAFLELEHLRKAPVASLPYGVQKRVELARALATEPRLLLLDEPMAGMTHEEKRDMCGFIRRVNESFGTTILIIEHDIGVVMGLSDRVVVLNYGRKIADGTPAEVRADREVIAAYLGSAAVGEAA